MYSDVTTSKGLGSDHRVTGMTIRRTHHRHSAKAAAAARVEPASPSTSSNFMLNRAHHDWHCDWLQVRVPGAPSQLEA